MICWTLSIFWHSGIWTQGLMFAGQAFYHWSFSVRPVLHGWYLAFEVMKPETTIWWFLISGTSNSIIHICVLIQLTLWNLAGNFFSLYWHRCLIWTWPNHHCMHKGSLTAFYCVLGYLGFLILANFSVDFLVMNLPNTFSEAKILILRMLVFCSV
jgi:vomeronasal 2 receptor